jgi:hypothetical protein
MNLTNRQVTITTLETNTFPSKTIANVTITETIAEGVYKQVASYRLEFDEAYTSLSDPALLNAVQEKLLEIPE